MAALTLARLGAGVYVLWGVAHLAFAVVFYRAALAMPFSDVQGRLLQNAWNIFFASVAVIAVAVASNWRNNAWGYWIGSRDGQCWGYRLHRLSRCRPATCPCFRRSWY